ncbi:hypothetical protein GCM10023223_05660 [Stackebrandtia albiflava]
MGVTPSADTTEIRQAYRRGVRDAHPDAGGDPDRFHAIQTAYEVLSHPHRRAEYDTARGTHRGWRVGKPPGRHAKGRRVKAWRVQTPATDGDNTAEVVARPWFVDINPHRRLRHSPSAWLRGALAAAATTAWLAISTLLAFTVLGGDLYPAVKALVFPYLIVTTVAVAASAARTLKPRKPVARIAILAAAAGVTWLFGPTAIAVQMSAHLVTVATVPWCVRRLRMAARLQAAVRSALRDYNAFGPAGARPSADRRTATVLRSLLERLPAARLFVRVPVGDHRAEYTVVCGRRVAVITPPVARTLDDTGAEHLPDAVADVDRLLPGAEVRGYVVWPHLPVERISGAHAVIRHLSASDAAAEIGRWLADDAYTLHLPTLRRLRDRLAGGDVGGLVPQQNRRTVGV